MPAPDQAMMRSPANTGATITPQVWCGVPMYGWLVKNMSPALMPGFSPYSFITYFAVWMQDMAWLAMVRPITPPSPGVGRSATWQSFDSPTLGEPETWRTPPAPPSPIGASRWRSTSKVIGSIIEYDHQILKRVDAQLLAGVQGQRGIHPFDDRRSRHAVAGLQLAMLVDRRLDKSAVEPDLARAGARSARVRFFHFRRIQIQRHAVRRRHDMEGEDLDPGLPRGGALAEARLVERNEALDHLGELAAAERAARRRHLHLVHLVAKAHLERARRRVFGSRDRAPLEVLRGTPLERLEQRVDALGVER